MLKAILLVMTFSLSQAVNADCINDYIENSRSNSPTIVLENNCGQDLEVSICYRKKGDYESHSSFFLRDNGRWSTGLWLTNEQTFYYKYNAASSDPRRATCN